MIETDQSFLSMNSKCTFVWLSESDFVLVIVGEGVIEYKWYNKEVTMHSLTPCTVVVLFLIEPLFQWTS